jgi:hypothetical protein
MDYCNGKIYMLEPTCEYEEGEVYYGSTTSTLPKRLYSHKCNHNKCSSKKLFDKYGKENIKIVLVCEYPCRNKSQLKREEGKYQRANKCVNINIAGRTREEYFKDTVEQRVEYSETMVSDASMRCMSYFIEVFK